MNVFTYCHKQGMTLQQAERYNDNINATATAIIDNLKTDERFTTDTGVYYPTIDLLGVTTGDNRQQMAHLKQALKAQGMEFFDNETLFRY